MSSERRLKKSHFNYKKNRHYRPWRSCIPSLHSIHCQSKDFSNLLEIEFPSFGNGWEIQSSHPMHLSKVSFWSLKIQLSLFVVYPIYRCHKGKPFNYCYQNSAIIFFLKKDANTFQVSPHSLRSHNVPGYF